MISRVVRTLAVRCVSKGFETLIHSIWTTLFGSSPPSTCHYFSYPHLLLVNNSSLQLLNLESGQVDFQQNTRRLLPEGCEILRVWFDGCDSFVLFTRSVSERTVYHVYLCTRKLASLELTTSVLLPLASWLDSPHLQLSVSQTVDGFEIYLLNPLAQPRVLVISLHSTPSITTVVSMT